MENVFRTLLKTKVKAKAKDDSPYYSVMDATVDISGNINPSMTILDDAVDNLVKK